MGCMVEVRELTKRYGGVLTVPLSGREREILALIAEGLPNGVIGQRLYMTEATIGTM